MKNIPPLSKFSAEGGTNSVNRECNPLQRSCLWSARNASESAICPMRAQASAEIVRVEGAKCRRFGRCARNPLRRSRASSARNAGDLAGVRATLCGDRARRAREMQAIWPVCAQPSAEIARVEGAKCRRECDLSGSGATLCGDRACRVRKMQARVRFGDSPLHFWRKSPTKRSFGRLAASLLEEVSHETRVLETWRFTFGGSLVQNALVCGQKWPVCSAKVVRERAFWSWTQKWRQFVVQRNVVRERALQGWTVCSTNVIRERAFLEMDSEVASL